MTTSADKNKIKELLDRRVALNGLFPSRSEIETRLSSDSLSFYYGIDPTGKDIHLGHTVQLLLLKGLIELGHKVTVLIGDFTAKIGDPTGKDKTRKPLTDEEIKNNSKTYLKQIHKILKEESFEVKHNSDWLSKLNMEKILELTSKFTVQQMIVRDMFQERIKNEKPIGINEFIYPLMQGYDSVAMQIDGEVGGHDQIFNMLVGRDLEKAYLDKDKIVLATKLLVNEASGKKMSKSEGEIIAVDDEPSEIRRKILAIDDRMTKTIFELCTEESQEWINDQDNKLGKTDPKEFKELLAQKLIEIYHGKDSTKKANELKSIEFVSNLAGTISAASFAPSVSAAKDLISGGAVEINGKVETNWKAELKPGDKIKVGKGKFGEIK